jgi:hypothetical protein
MAKKLMFALIILILLMSGVNAIIREGNCSSGETFLFSVFQPNDTHISSSQDFYNYSVCYPESITVNFVEGDCGPDENLILSLYQPNDTHISITKGYFNYSLCSPNVICGRPPSCAGISVGSLYQGDDSHWGDVGYFNNTLCCVKFPEATSKAEVEKPEEPKDEEPRMIVIRKIAEKIKEIGKEIGFILFGILLIVFVYVKKDKCYYCRKNFKRKDLVLYKNKSCCKNCYKIQKAKE